MGRELRRVPLGFDYPLNRVWYGHFFDCISTCFCTDDDSTCDQCIKMAKIKHVPMTDFGCPDFDAYIAEPSEKLKEIFMWQRC